MTTSPGSRPPSSADANAPGGLASPPPTPLDEVLSAILRGVVGTTPATYDGLTKDEALWYAGLLAERVKAVLRHIGDIGCSCRSDLHYASLPDHELDCFAQIEHLLTTFTPPDSASPLMTSTAPEREA